MPRELDHGPRRRARGASLRLGARHRERVALDRSRAGRGRPHRTPAVRLRPEPGEHADPLARTTATQRSTVRRSPEHGAARHPQRPRGSRRRDRLTARDPWTAGTHLLRTGGWQHARLHAQGHPPAHELPTRRLPVRGHLLVPGRLSPSRADHGAVPGNRPAAGARRGTGGRAGGRDELQGRGPGPGHGRRHRCPGGGGRRRGARGGRRGDHDGAR